jgi:hypothetical protein
MDSLTRRLLELIDQWPHLVAMTVERYCPLGPFEYLTYFNGPFTSTIHLKYHFRASDTLLTACCVTGTATFSLTFLHVFVLLPESHFQP